MTASVAQLLPQEMTDEAEARRLTALRRYDILDTPPDGSFDRITTLAAQLLDVPIAIVSLVDHDRIWFKSRHGLDVQEIGRAPGLCASAILQGEPWILTDAKLDVRSLANPLVAGDFGLRFYVGVPLQTSDGFNLGTLCVIDRKPRAVTEQQVAMLKDLALLVMDQMELRLSARRAVADLSQVIAEKEAALRRSEIMAKEIDHRVMNSLQLIASLLRLHSQTVGSPQAGDQLKLAADRVTAIARVHQHIYLSDGIEHAECHAYLQRLCEDLSFMLRSTNRGNIRVEGIEAKLPTAQVVCIGMIVNELVTNAVKHGKGEIVVSFMGSATEGYALSVADAGGGLPASFDLARSTGLGMKVVASLVRQLRGQLELGSSNGAGGAKFTVRFGGTDP